MGIPGVWQYRPRNAGNQLQRSSGDGICRAAMLANERRHPTGGHARSSNTPQSVWARNPRHRCEYITATLHQMAERRTERRGQAVSADTSAEISGAGASEDVTALHMPSMSMVTRSVLATDAEGRRREAKAREVRHEPDEMQRAVTRRSEPLQRDQRHLSKTR